MKLFRILPAIILTLNSLPFFAQIKLDQFHMEITKAEYDNCQDSGKIKFTEKVSKKKGKLVIPVAGGKTINFMDKIASDEHFEYDHMGKITGTNFSLVRLIEFNSESYYLINIKTGKTDTLPGIPLFSKNNKFFVAKNIPDTDGQQVVQVGFIKEGKIVKKNYFLPKVHNIQLEETKCPANDGSVLLKYNNNTYFRFIYL